MKLLDRISTASTTTRADALKRYAALLDKPDADGPDAEAELRGLMATLTLTTDDVARHAAAVRQAKTLERKLGADRSDELATAVAKATRAFDKAEKAYHEAREELTGASFAENAYSQARSNDADRLRDMKARNPMAFGQEPPPPEPEPAPIYYGNRPPDQPGCGMSYTDADIERLPPGRMGEPVMV